MSAPVRALLRPHGRGRQTRLRWPGAIATSTGCTARSPRSSRRAARRSCCSSGSPGSASPGSSARSRPARGRRRASSSVAAPPTATASPTGRCARSCCRRSAGDRWRPWLEPTDEGRAAAAVIAATLGLGGHAPAEAAPWAFRMLLEALARDRPLLLALDDAHWAEPPLLDLVDELAAGRGARPRPLRRPAGAAERPAGVGARRPDPARAGGRRGEPPPARRPVGARGSDARAHRRASAREPAVLRAARGPRAESGEEGGLPPALHALIAARLDALEPAHRRLIEAAAVEGEPSTSAGSMRSCPTSAARESEDRWRSSSGASCCCRRSR